MSLKVIHKHRILMFQPITLKLAEGAQILSVGIDPQGQVSLWEMHTPDASLEDKVITPVHTGQPTDISSQQQHIGTVVQHQIVAHFFIDLSPTKQAAG